VANLVSLNFIDKTKGEKKMTLYADSNFPVPKDLEAIHANQLNQLAKPGSWGTGAQRLAIAAEARQAGIDAGMLEEPADKGTAPDITLPEVVCKVVHKLAVSPKDFLEDSYLEAKNGGLSNEEYIEIVGIVARTTNMDVFARGIGVSLQPLPAACAGEPSRIRPQAAIQEKAWVPTVPNSPDGGSDADTIYGGMHYTYIVRGLSLVPDELRMHVELEETQYLPLNKIMNPEYSHHEGFSRAPTEIVAARVSALNECFF
jgi:hypothetical protein